MPGSFSPEEYLFMFPIGVMICGFKISVLVRNKINPFSWGYVAELIYFNMLTLMRIF